MNQKGENKKLNQINSERIGVPPNIGGPMWVNEMTRRMYQNMGDVPSSRSLLMKIVIICFSLILIVIGGFLVFFVFNVSFLNFNITSISAIPPFFLGLIFLGVGIKIAYSNTKSIFKK
ncbi:MAG: hypothetical protein AB1333_00825 [Patescibacteria group bacterium]